MESKQSHEGSLTAGYFWSFGSTALPLVSVFVTSLIIARWMGPHVVGLINWTMALTTVFLIVGKFGIGNAASRMISEYQVSAAWKIPGIIRTSLILRLFFTVPAAAVMALFARTLSEFFGEPVLLPLFRLGAILAVAVSLNELSALMILGLKRFRTLFVMRLSMLILRVGFVVAAAVLALDAEGVIGGYSIAAFLPALAVFGILARIGPHAAGMRYREPIRGRLFKLSATLAVSGASVTIYSLLDKLMLGRFEGATQVGLYSVARNLVETSLFPTFALIMVLRPALAGEYTSGDVERCSYLVNRSIRYAIYFSACVVVVFACLARPLVTGLYTGKFSVSADLLLLFLPLIVMRSIGAVILPGLIAADKAGTYALLTLGGALLNFVLNMLLIPLWGARGAVVSTLFSYMPIEVLGLRALARVFPRFWHRTDTFRAAMTVVSAVATAALYNLLGIRPETLPFAIALAVAVTAVFVVMLLLSRAVTVREIMDIAKPFMRINRRA